MGVYSRGGRWVVSYTQDRQRYRKSFDTQEQAEDEYRRLAGCSAESRRLNEYAQLVLRHMKVTHAPNTVIAMAWHLKALEALGDPLLSRIDLGVVRDYQAKRLQEVSPATANREVTALSKVLTQAVADGHLAAHPLKGLSGKLKAPEPQGRLRYLSIEEIGRLRDCCRDPLLGIVEVAVHTGMRMAEIFQLQWSSVDSRGNCVTIKRKAKEEYSVVPISKTALAAIQRQKRRGSDYVFPGRDGGMRTNCKTSFHAAVKAAGLKDVTFHTLRHTFASHAVMNGMDLRTLQEILGHKKLDMVMRYAHLADRHKRAQLSRVDRVLARAGATNPAKTEGEKSSRGLNQAPSPDKRS